MEASPGPETSMYGVTMESRPALLTAARLSQPLWFIPVASLLPFTGGSLQSLNFCNLQQSSLVSEEAETMLSRAIRAAQFVTAETVYMKAHKQVGSSQLEGDFRSDRGKQGLSSVCL